MLSQTIHAKNEMTLLKNAMSRTAGNAVTSSQSNGPILRHISIFFPLCPNTQTAEIYTSSTEFVIVRRVTIHSNARVGLKSKHCTYDAHQAEPHRFCLDKTNFCHEPTVGKSQDRHQNCPKRRCSFRTTKPTNLSTFRFSWAQAHAGTIQTYHNAKDNDHPERGNKGDQWSRPNDHSCTNDKIRMRTLQQLLLPRLEQQLLERFRGEPAHELPAGSGVRLRVPGRDHVRGNEDGSVYLGGKTRGPSSRTT